VWCDVSACPVIIQHSAKQTDTFSPGGPDLPSQWLHNKRAVAHCQLHNIGQTATACPATRLRAVCTSLLCVLCMQAKAANSQASDVRQQGYLKAALQGALDKATPVQPPPWFLHHHRPAVKGMIAMCCSAVCDCATGMESSLHSTRPSFFSRLSSQEHSQWYTTHGLHDCNTSWFQCRKTYRQQHCLMDSNPQADLTL